MPEIQDELIGPSLVESITAIFFVAVATILIYLAYLSSKREWFPETNNIRFPSEFGLSSPWQRRYVNEMHEYYIRLWEDHHIVSNAIIIINIALLVIWTFSARSYLHDTLRLHKPRHIISNLYQRTMPNSETLKTIGKVSDSARYQIYTGSGEYRLSKNSDQILEVDIQGAEDIRAVEIEITAFADNGSEHPIALETRRFDSSGAYFTNISGYTFNHEDARMFRWRVPFSQIAGSNVSLQWIGDIKIRLDYVRSARESSTSAPKDIVVVKRLDTKTSIRLPCAVQREPPLVSAGMFEPGR